MIATVVSDFRLSPLYMQMSDAGSREYSEEILRIYCSITLVKTMDFSPSLSDATQSTLPEGEGQGEWEGVALKKAERVGGHLLPENRGTMCSLNSQLAARGFWAGRVTSFSRGPSATMRPASKAIIR